jgi:hypothetical protein
MSAYTNAHGAARGAHHPTDGREWVVLLSPDTRRMMSTPEVQAEVSAGTLARETLVWRTGMSEWVAIGNIIELDVPLARAHHAPAAASWDAPMAASQRSAGHMHARPHAHRRASNSELMQEVVTTGAVAMIMVAVTLYMLSLGGAFAPLTAQHASGASQGTHAAQAARAPASH